MGKQKKAEDKEKTNKDQAETKNNTASKKDLTDQETDDQAKMDQEEKGNPEEPNNEENTSEDQIKKLEKELEKSKDQYLRLAAEFDNYKRRTLNEKMELTKTAARDILLDLLPIIDDFDRAIHAMEKATGEPDEGLVLIYNKCLALLEKNGVKEIEALHQDFNTDEHEAMTKIPASQEDLKGKVIDVLEKGYYLNDKILRYAKVVVGE